MFTNVWVLVIAVVVLVTAEAWMNGDYFIANPVAGRTHPSHRGQHIDVYSYNISTRYSEVYWTMQPSVPLPLAFVERFKGKVAAFTGYEVDAVRINNEGEEESVPIYEQYNHHHNAYVMGSEASMVHMGVAQTRGHHPTAPCSSGSFENNWRPWGPPMTDSGGPQIPTTWYVVDGNGGEYRKSLHSVGTGFAHLVKSPAAFHIQPMMINTKNPYGKGPGGPLPRAKGEWKGAQSPPNASYSGLLECPCTDRKKKVVTNHDTRHVGTCPTKVPTAEGCFIAAAELGLVPVVKNASMASGIVPAGCYVQGTAKGYEVYFNTDNASSVSCGPNDPTKPTRASGAADTELGVNVSLDVDMGVNCSAATNDITGHWSWPGSRTFPTPYDVSIRRLAGKADWFTVTGGSSAPLCQKSSCTGYLNGSTFSMVTGFKLVASISDDWLTFRWTNGATWTRHPPCTGLVTMTMSGPDNVWFGAGFGATTMSGTYAVIVDGTGKVQERQMGDHDAGVELTQSVEVLSNTQAKGQRVVTFRRAAVGVSPQHFSFNADSKSIGVITAVGEGPQLGYHRSRGSSPVSLVPVDAPLCICSAGTSGSIDGVGFSKKCHSEPISDLLAQANPTCRIETYNGGLACCSHKSILLHSDQEIPSAVDTYRMKFRLYYENYNNQLNTFFMFWTNEQGSGEFDIPQCLKGMSKETCEAMGISNGIHTTHSIFRVRDAMKPCRQLSDPWCAAGWNESSNVLLVRAGAHCHAPACMSAELYNEDTGELLCRNTPLYGSSDKPFDELAYAAGIPPCMWGEANDGLASPPRLRLDTHLRSVHRKNATFYHYGVMAQWQMRGAFEHPSAGREDDHFWV